MTLTADRLRELLDYDQASGWFTWKVTRCGNHARKGERAGAVRRCGYRHICVDGRRYQEHRLVWLLVHGESPQGVVDHINGDPTDNRLENLRLVTKTGNRQNQRKASKNSSTGFLGVVPRRDCDSGLMYGASIQADGRRFELGTFATPEAAHEAYLTAKRQLHSTCTI